MNLDTVDTVLSTAYKAVGVGHAANNLATTVVSNVATRLASGMIKEKIENDVRVMFSDANMGFNVFIGTMVVLIIILLIFMSIHTSNPGLACKLTMYFAFFSISLLASSLIGIVIMKLTFKNAGKSLFGDDGSIYQPIVDIYDTS